MKGDLAGRVNRALLQQKRSFCNVFQQPSKNKTFFKPVFNGKIFHPCFLRRSPIAIVLSMKQKYENLVQLFFFLCIYVVATSIYV